MCILMKDSTNALSLKNFDDIVCGVATVMKLKTSFRVTNKQCAVLLNKLCKKATWPSLYMILLSMQEINKLNIRRLFKYETLLFMESEKAITASLKNSSSPI